MSSNPFVNGSSLPENSARAFQLDPDGPYVKLSEAQSRLFSTDNHCLEMVTITQQDTSRVILKDPKQLQWHVQNASSIPDSSCIFHIFQLYTWSAFQISKPMFDHLISELNIHSSFLDIVQLFGEKDGPVEEDLTSYFDHIIPYFSAKPAEEVKTRAEICSLEIGYSLKYVERHGRTYPADPFSIRETGVYQKWNPSTAQYSWILLQPSPTIKAGVERLCSELPETHQFQIHAALVLGVSENWRSYTNYLEDIFSNIVGRSFLTKAKTLTSKDSINVQFDDIQRLQILVDKLYRVSHIIGLNMGISRQIQGFAKRLRNAWLPLDPLTEWAFSDFDAKMDESIFRHQTYKARVDSMLKRSEGVGSLIRNILDFRAANIGCQINEGNTTINSNMRDLIKQGLQENKYMKDMASRATRDTRSMAIISLITTIFLPATLVATLFGSNFFGFENVGGNRTLRVASNFWIFVVATVILLTLTISGWWYIWKRSSSWIPSSEIPDSADELEAQVAKVSRSAGRQ